MFGHLVDRGRNNGSVDVIGDVRRSERGNVVLLVGELPAGANPADWAGGKANVLLTPGEATELGWELMKLGAGQ